MRSGQQRRFLLSVCSALGLNLSGLAQLVGVHPRCMSDWSREASTLPLEVFHKLAKASGIVMSPHEVVVDEWFRHGAAVMGGKARVQAHGPPGTYAGRRLGGSISQLRRQQHPELYANCNLKKEISRPHECSDLAELIGIFLGDGSIHSRYQAAISLNAENEQGYAGYVVRLIRRLFSVEPSVHQRAYKGVVEIVLNSVDLVAFLLTKGLVSGNKVRSQVSVPLWVQRKQSYAVACVRGLVDTDGCIFTHRHEVRGRVFLHVGLNFSNASAPLLAFTHRTLLQLGMSPKLSRRYVNLYRQDDVLRYARIVGSSNSHHEAQLRRYLRVKKTPRRDARAA